MLIDFKTEIKTGENSREKTEWGAAAFNEPYYEKLQGTFAQLIVNIR